MQYILSKIISFVLSYLLPIWVHSRHFLYLPTFAAKYLQNLTGQTRPDKRLPSSNVLSTFFGFILLHEYCFLPPVVPPKCTNPTRQLEDILGGPNYWKFATGGDICANTGKYEGTLFSSSAASLLVLLLVQSWLAVQFW